MWTTLRTQISSAVIPAIDIWRCAALMIQYYDDPADIEAATRADELQKKGGLDGSRCGSAP
jgi:hypothetical protein